MQVFKLMEDVEGKMEDVTKHKKGVGLRYSKTGRVKASATCIFAL